MYLNIKKDTILYFSIILLISGCGNQSETKNELEKTPTIDHGIYAWQEGQTYDYQLQMSSRADFQGTGGTMFDFALSARARLIPLDVSETEVKLGLVLSEVKFETQQNGAAGKFNELAGELERKPYLFTLKKGIVKEARFYEDASAFAVAILRTFSASIQFPKSTDRGSNSWISKEYDSTGLYVADCEWDPQKGLFTKSKRAYESLLSNAKTSRIMKLKSSLPDVEESMATFELKNGIIERMKKTERMRIKMSATGYLSSTTQMELARTNISDTPKKIDWLALEAKTKVLHADAPFVAPVDREVLDAARIGGMPFEKVVAGLETMAEDPRKEILQKKDVKRKETPSDEAEKESWLNDWSKLFAAVPAYFRQQPETIDVALKKIGEGSPASKSLLAGLGPAGTQKAQDALLSVMNDKKLSESLRKDAAFSLIRATPKLATAEQLEEYLGDETLRVHAIYGLGTYARKLGENGNKGGANRIIELLIRELKSSEDRIDKVHCLRGIANSGNDRAFEAVRPFLEGKDRVLRAVAAQAIRLMKNPEVEGILARMLVNKEEHLTVRLAVLRALAVREPTPDLASAVSTVALDEQQRNIRHDAVKLLGSWYEKMPELEDTLSKIAENEKEESIGKLAAKALGTSQ